MRLNAGRPLAVLLGGVMAVAMIFTFSPTAWADDISTKFVPGTTVNGVSIAGLSVDSAKEKIERTLGSEYQVTIRRNDGTTEKMNGADFGFKATVEGNLQELLDKQNANGRSSGPAFDNADIVNLKTEYNLEQLYERVMQLNCVGGSEVVETKNARISEFLEGQAFTVIPEVLGNSLDVEKTKAAIKEAVDSGMDQVSLEEKGCYQTVTVTKEDQSLNELCNLMNSCKDMTITYQFGENTEILSGATICTWMTGASEGKIQVNRDYVSAFVRALADKYNTVGASRMFKTTSGKELSLKGPYGWKMNVEAETNALIAMIQTGQTQTREPEYSEKAASRSGSDWGGTYVEIDMTKQHVYLYKNGAVVWDAPCVTGNVSKGHTTPPGIYSLYYKQTDRVLRGAKQADGSYEYESPVDYWMPFNGGIGLHDANWRSKFGGTIYQYSGSHGCINLPPSKTKALYDQIYAGIPVICHG